ncbi:AAA family ATPase [Planctomycetota bacterium]|nr:AAA family ATPase [Planctomycetota bacterium]
MMSATDTNQVLDDKEIQFIEPTNPTFDDDKLSREQCAHNLTAVLETYKGEGKTVAISGPWGCGKTFFVKMWRNKLESKEYKTVFFNAWANDHSESPSVAFLAHLTSLIDTSTGNESKFEIAKKNLKGSFVKLAKQGLVYGVGKGVNVATQGLVDGHNLVKKASAFGGSVLKRQKSEYEQQLDRDIRLHLERSSVIEEYKACLAAYVEAVSPEKPVYFFIDELDRCRPDFAVELLESIKHYFDVPNLFFVLSIDGEQLAEAVKGHYGSGFDGQRYLRRFVDLRYTLNTSNIGTFCDSLIDKKYPFAAKAKGYRFYDILGNLSLSLRDIDQLFSQLDLASRLAESLTHEKTSAALGLLAYICAFEKHDPNFIHYFMHDRKAMLNFFNNIYLGRSYARDELREIEWRISCNTKYGHEYEKDLEKLAKQNQGNSYFAADRLEYFGWQSQSSSCTEQLLELYHFSAKTN